MVRFAIAESVDVLAAAFLWDCAMISEMRYSISKMSSELTKIVHNFGDLSHSFLPVSSVAGERTKKCIRTNTYLHLSR